MVFSIKKYIIIPHHISRWSLNDFLWLRSILFFSYLFLNLFCYFCIYSDFDNLNVYQ